MGFRVQSFGSLKVRWRVLGVLLRVEGLELRVQGLGFWVV